MKLVLDEQNEHTQCFNCDAEFKVHSLFDEDVEPTAVLFCPFCGEELDGIDEEEIWDDETEA